MYYNSSQWNPVALQNVFAFDMMCVNSQSNVPSVEVNVPCIDNISHNEFFACKKYLLREKVFPRNCRDKISWKKYL